MAEARVVNPLARPTEAACQTTVIAAARRFGWLCHAQAPSQRPDGRWVTALHGDPGFVDLILCHPYHRLLWAVELKRRPNRVEPAQQRWLDNLAVHIVTRVVYVPEELDSFILELAHPTIDGEAA